MSQVCGYAPTLFDDETMYLSHEWSEAITDPISGGWTDGGNEIGDKCFPQTGANGPWTVQLEWSNLDGACVASESAYQAPTASFLAPTTGPAGQRLSFDAAGSSDPSGNSAAISGTSYLIPSRITSYQWS